MTSRNFETALKKGEIGEQIVRKILEEKGWIVYKPVTDGAHCFDMLTIKDKRRAIAIDVKAKSRRNKYPDTGINQKHFEEYLSFSQKHNMPFWLFFVDEMLGKIYGNHLAELEKPRVVDNRMYPYEWRTQSGEKIRLWPLEAMRDIAFIKDSEVKKLIDYSQRSYKYEVEA